ncbi:hypothetical protein AVEN_7484-1, partial [Araneus ventricosus]
YMEASAGTSKLSVLKLKPPDPKPIPYYWATVVPRMQWNVLDGFSGHPDKLLNRAPAVKRSTKKMVFRMLTRTEAQGKTTINKLIVDL